MTNKRILWGLVTRRERLGLSRWGWLTVFLLGFGAFLIWLLHIQPFLMTSQRVNSDVYVMEGWIQEYAVREVSARVVYGTCQKIYTTGGPVTGTDNNTNDYSSLAMVGASLLKKWGTPDNLIQPVPCHETGRDRTYSSAVALRTWFQTHGLKVHSFNVFTEDAHARRTRLLFQEAFGPEVEIGIIAIPDPDYDPAHWWRYSEGVRMVLGETIAYLYARLLFHPPEVQS